MQRSTLVKSLVRLTKQNPLYSEISNQKSQVVMLFNGHIQSVVLERRIFEYYRHLLPKKLDTSQAVTEVALFCTSRKKDCLSRQTYRRSARSSHYHFESNRTNAKKFSA
ncbi:hypothetical protein PEC18_36045 [Paucibacter sp. O1-1]|nr:hypothetical protein [Paucibacter sp. O1-1]MDA3831069.1 hypothetical protein [Paucibacter sp. O1-1]